MLTKRKEQYFPYIMDKMEPFQQFWYYSRLYDYNCSRSKWTRKLVFISLNEMNFPI